MLWAPPAIGRYVYGVTNDGSRARAFVMKMRGDLEGAYVTCAAWVSHPTLESGRKSRIGAESLNAYRHHGGGNHSRGVTISPGSFRATQPQRMPKAHGFDVLLTFAKSLKY